MKTGFDNEKYLKMQSESIKKRIDMFDSKLYLEFGGKLFDDYHASRVLPGFDPNSKIEILKQLKDDIEIVFCINASDIEKKKVRADFGITYDKELLRLVNNLKNIGIYVSSVVITLYKGQQEVDNFRRILEEEGLNTYVHTFTKGYPTDIETIVSEDGYGKNEYIKTSRKIVVVTAPGPNSGKLATCLSQLYHEYKRGNKAGYAKYETFPVWNLALKHPVNMAYEAATADLGDINMIDAFHLEEYGKSAVNYNRDLTTFPILKNILNKIIGEDIYKSPTDMGVNMVGFCISDDEVIKEASKKEIIRRYYNVLCDEKLDKIDKEAVNRIKVLMNELEINESDLEVVNVAKQKEIEKSSKVICIKLTNNKIITGRETDLLTPSSAMILNAIKELTNIPDEVFLLSPSVLEPILKINKDVYLQKRTKLSLHEVLIALSICKVTNPIINKAMEKLIKLKDCEAHASYIVNQEEQDIFKGLGINLTCEPKF
ncbi:MAG: DUF1846 domain-containing protein [Clostridia bacterium]